jgi:hypothetical protein
VVPEILIVNFVVVLHLGNLHEVAKKACASIRCALLQISVTILYILAE